MPKGGELRIGLERIRIQSGETPPRPEMEAGEWLRATVTDSGTGISSEVRPHIFDPFFTTKERGEGTGLGLAQVYGIVKQHEGHIDVTTKVGEGTTFTLYLPVLLVPQVAMPAEEERALTRGHGETILVVEDDLSLREALVDSLEMLNYQVLEAEDGREALATFEQHGDEIALVLSDVVMPEMGGTALFQALRQRDPAVKVVLLTGYPMGEEIEDLKSEGIIEPLQKPPSLDQLARVVARAIQRVG